MKTIALLIIGGCLLSQFAWAERPMNELPMYGSKAKSDCYLNTDDRLIDWATREFGSRELASKDAASRGWKAYYQGDFDTAIKRFNQGWMFDRENPEVYWGFGLIMGQRASPEDPESNLKESIRFLEMANDRAPEDGRIIGDLAFSHTILGHFFQSYGTNDRKAQEHFGIAGELFSKAFNKTPDYPPIVANWSIFYFYTGDYQQAKNKADEAILSGYQFSPDYIKEIEDNLK